MVRDEARLRQGHNDQSRQSHQYSKTTLNKGFRFHISTPLGIEPGSLMMGNKRVDHWISGTVCECSEIADSPQLFLNEILSFQARSVQMCNMDAFQKLNTENVIFTS